MIRYRKILKACYHIQLSKKISLKSYTTITRDQSNLRVLEKLLNKNRKILKSEINLHNSNGTEQNPAGLPHDHHLPVQNQAFNDQKTRVTDSVSEAHS